MIVETRLDGIILTAETPLDSQLLHLTVGELRVANWGYELGRGLPGPSSTYIQFLPKSPERIRREKRAALRYRLSNWWRWVRSLRVRVETRNC